jgi:hypothetical protein
LAWGHRWPVPEHFLLAMVYEDDGMAARLHSLGASQPAILEALRRRGVRVPEVEPPAYRPWRGEHGVEVDEAEPQPLIDLLIRQHPPGSEWRWGSTGCRASHAARGWMRGGHRAGRGPGAGKTARRRLSR